MVISPEKLQFAVTETGGLGDGIAVYEGRRIVIPYSLAGDTVTAELTSKYKASLREIITPSPERAVAPCPHFTACGGCSQQHLPDALYQQLKHQRLIESVARAGYDGSSIRPMIRVPAGSRRRASFKVKDGKLGYFSAASHRHVPISECLVIDPQLRDLALAFPVLISGLSRPVNEVMLTKSDSGFDAVIIADYQLSVKDKAACEAFAARYDLARISWQSEQRIALVVSRRPVQLRLAESNVTLPERYFLQATKEGQQAITDFILEFTKDATSIADLYAGCGSYSFPLAKIASVTAIEGDRAMVTAMKQAMSTEPLTVEQRDLFKQPLTVAELAAYDALVINPPRNGAGTQISHIAESVIPIVVMVSCNPGSFERDSALLRQGGYRLVAAQAIDQFLWSSHLEMVAAFVKY